ncbi:MAG TPA: type VI secretion system protein TssA [Acetobacteraceae bacterium]|jgi:type VI secretion system ImpA family protein|nr:type VI secretion system protein TssA [Acetobacteraceae bacterium]
MSATGDIITGLACLLAPIDGDNETGNDLRLSPIYRAIAEARREENARLPQGIWTRNIKRADWPMVERLCLEALQHHGKDLQVAAWVTEAWTRQHGFAGLGAGLDLLTRLCRMFWPGLHPAIEDDDFGPRIAPFEWLNAYFPALLRDMPIVRAAGETERAYTWTDYVNGQLLESLRQRDPRSFEKSEAAGAVTLAAFAAAREQTELAFFRELHTGLEAAATALAELNTTLGQVCGREAPGLGGIGTALSDIQGLISAEFTERNKSILTMPLRAAHPAVPAAVPTPAAQQAVSPATPAQLYAQLTQIAEMLHRMEPHSPAPYLIDRAVAWGEMSFAELIGMFASSGLALEGVMHLLGLAADDGVAAPLTDSE